MRNKGLSFYKKKKKISQALLREIFSWIFSIALSVFLAGVIVIFLGRSARVVGMSMEPTLENGQQIYIDRRGAAVSDSCLLYLFEKGIRIWYTETYKHYAR